MGSLHTQGLPQRRGEKGNDLAECGVYQAVQSAYSAEKVCADPPLRHPEQQLEAWETAGFTSRVESRKNRFPSPDFA